MSYESRAHIAADLHNHNKSVVAYHSRDAQFGSAARYTSSVVVNIRQLQTELHSQNQHDKEILHELNQRFHLFVDRVQMLQSQNSKLRSAVADMRRRYTSSSFDLQLDDSFLAVHPELLKAHHDKIDCHWNVELFHLQSAIYKQLIEIEHQWVDKRAHVLEDELKHSTSALVTLRASYTEVQREVDSLYLEGDNLFKRYLTLSHDWCHVKKQRSKWELSLDTLKNSIRFYKNIRGKLSVDVYVPAEEDLTQYWALEYERIVKKIRFDFENFYAATYREMSASYESKMLEMERTMKQAVHVQHAEITEFSSFYQTQQLEYEKVQKSMSYERECTIKLEHTYSKLEGDYKAIQLQYEEQLEAQSADMYHLQETIMSMVFDVDELRRSKVNLEAEIIVYRLLLESIGIQKQVIVTAPLEQQVIVTAPLERIGDEVTGKILVRRQKKRSVGIHECAPDGTFISVVNYSTSKEIDISKWILKRHIDVTTNLRYTIPDGVRLHHGGELRIYTKGSATSIVDTSSYKVLVNEELASWGMGSSVETFLFNRNGDEESSFTQKLSF